MGTTEQESGALDATNMMCDLCDRFRPLAALARRIRHEDMVSTSEAVCRREMSISASSWASSCPSACSRGERRRIVSDDLGDARNAVDEDETRRGHAALVGQHHAAL